MTPSVRQATPGDKLGTVRATPTKRALRNDASKLGVIDAITEIIDNAIDNHAKQDRLHRAPQGLVIDLEMSQDLIRITEDSGGVTPEDLQAFVQVGVRGASVDSPRIGVWGAGQKLAVAALGTDVTISTRYWNPTVRYEVGDRLADQVVLTMDERWWASEEDWDVPAFEPKDDLQTGVTTYEIRKLNRRIDDIVIDEVCEQLRNFYGDMLAEARATIRINGQPLEGKPRISTSALAEEFAWPPGYEPSEHIFELEEKGQVIEAGQWKEVDQKLRIRVIAGLTARQAQDKAGVWFFGVPETESGAQLGPRYFAGPEQSEAVGYTSGPRSLLRKGHPTLGRLRIYVICYGDSEIIPWGLPGSAVKRGYNASNIFADAIREAIREVAKPYVRFTTKAREIDLLPYSTEWNSMSVQDRKALLRRGAYLSAPEDVDERGVKDKVGGFLNHQFKPKAFLEWDHTASTQPPSQVPALDETASKNVVALLTERDKRLKEIKGLDPGEAVETLMSTLDELRSRDSGGWTPADEEGAEPQERPIPVSVRLTRSMVTRLTAATGKSNRSEAIVAALEAYLAEQDDSDG